jgi:uncharacterized protein YbjT (DUF2867 family)
MARALIVACGCRGRELAAALVDEGWLVRGTSRDVGSLGAIEDAGAEAALADPGEVASVLDHVADVTLVFWLLGSAAGDHEQVGALHGSRLERVLEELVDTPVRGFVYDGAGTAGADVLGGGAAIARAASERWHIPVEVVDADPSDVESWRTAMVAAASRLTAT